MRVVIAMDSFKGSLDAAQACCAVAEGFMAASPDYEVDIMPIADGGEGFLSVLADSAGGNMIYGACHDPLSRVICAPFLRMPDGSAVIETAAASGLTLVKQDERDIMHSTTYGTGEQLLSALQTRAKRIFIGLGGSATCDGGIGLMRALGMKFFCGEHEITQPHELIRIERVDSSALTPLIKDAELIAACDVDSPLTGENGAAHVFGAQKGASPDQVLKLDMGLDRLRSAMSKSGFSMDCPGAGAAGGLGGALKALGFRLCSGVDTVLDITHAKERIARAELTIVGEGMTDSQSAAGKAPCGIARLARELGCPAVCISGSLGADYQQMYEHGLTAAFASVVRPMDLKCAMDNAYESLRARACDVARLWATARGK